MPPAYSHRLAHGERQRHRLAGVKVAVQRRFRYPHHRRYGGVDLQRSGRVGHRAREVGGIAGTVGDGRRVLIDRRDCEVGRVLSGTDRIAEGQRAGAGPAGIGCHAAIVERQCRRAAGYRHRLAQIERQCHGLAGIEVACPGGDPGSRSHHRRHRRRVVSICSVPAGLVTAPERLAALPAPSVTVAAF